MSPATDQFRCIALVTNQLVELTYFRPSGKYYDEGAIYLDGSMEIHKIWDHIEHLRDIGRLPGLIDGARNYIISIDVPGHYNQHPRLLMLPMTPSPASVSAELTHADLIREQRKTYNDYVQFNQ